MIEREEKTFAAENPHELARYLQMIVIGCKPFDTLVLQRLEPRANDWDDFLVTLVRQAAEPTYSHWGLVA
jgi:hypothetical protein